MSSVVDHVCFEKKMTFSMKLDQNYDCVFKIMLSTKITLSEFMKNMC